MPCDLLSRRAVAHLMDIQVREPFRAKSLCLGGILRHGLAYDLNRIDLISSRLGKCELDPVQSLVPVAHIDHIIFAPCRPGIARCRQTDLFVGSLIFSRIPRDRQQDLGGSCRALGGLILKTVNIQTCLTGGHSRKADSYFGRFLCHCKGDLLPLLLLDRFSVEIDPGRYALIVKCDALTRDPDEFLSRIFLEQDPLHQSLLALRDVHSLIVLAADPSVRGKAERERVLVFIDTADKPLQSVIVRPQVIIVVGEPFFLFISEGKTLRIIAQEIPDPGDLIEHSAVIQRVVQMDHPVELSRLVEKL